MMCAAVSLAEFMFIVSFEKSVMKLRICHLFICNTNKFYLYFKWRRAHSAIDMENNHIFDH